ncbi:unnamed protein product [Cuscuta campestris]|uniref:Uncharacterized protein n=1 Tax=Cuscuta campestris TaxID=132261 RepID=A0A484NP74_9ASTE|nr:unnamed protein product [Cuscuta campestris]
MITPLKHGSDTMLKQPKILQIEPTIHVHGSGYGLYNVGTNFESFDSSAIKLGLVLFLDRHHKLRDLFINGKRTVSEMPKEVIINCYSSELLGADVDEAQKGELAGVKAWIG